MNAAYLPQNPPFCVMVYCIPHANVLGWGGGLWFSRRYAASDDT